MKRLIFFILLIVLLSGCSGSAPRIIQVFWQMNFVLEPESENVQEELAFFVQIEDEDGVADIQRVSLIHDESRLFWDFTNISWTVREQNGEVWLGKSRLSGIGGDSFPRGLYRVRLEDRSGAFAESEIFIDIDESEIEELEFPEVDIKGNSMVVKGESPRYMIWFFDGEERLTDSVFIKNGTHFLNRLSSPGKEGVDKEEFYIFLYNDLKSYGLLNGPYEYPLK